MSSNGNGNNPDPFCPFICPRATGGPFTEPAFSELFRASLVPTYASDDDALRDLRDAAVTILSATAYFQDGSARTARIGAALTVASGALHAVRVAYVEQLTSGVHRVKEACQ